MKNKKTHAPADVKAKTGVEQFFFLVGQLQLFLKPSIADALMKAGHEMREELFQAAVKELLEDKELELMFKVFSPMLRDYRDMLKIYSSATPPRNLWHLRPIIRKIIELYGPKDPDKL